MRALLLALGLALAFCGGAFADAASDCYQDKDRDLSIRVCTLIVEGRVTGDKTAAYYWRGADYHNKGDYDHAIADEDQAVRLNPQLFPQQGGAYLWRGKAYVTKGDYDRAIADFDQAIRLNPQLAVAYNWRGSAYYSKGDYDRAIDDEGQAIQLDPQMALAYYLRGRASSQKRDYDRAIADFDQAIRLNPQHALAFNWRGAAYSRKGEYEHAIADYGQAIRLDPKDASAYLERGGVYYNKGDYDNAIADEGQAIRLDKKSPRAYCGRGVVYYEKGQFDSAIADFDQAALLDPKFAAAYNFRGWTFYKKGDKDRAIVDFNEAVRLDPKDASAREGQGHVILAMGNAKAALDDFNEALRLKADRIGSLWGRGQIYEIQGLRSLALADYKRAIELKATNSIQTDFQNSARARLIVLEAAAVAPPAPVASEARKPAPMGRRVALVIGNAAYKAVDQLANPRNDAGAVAGELSRLGFEVIERYDLGVVAMRRALGEFEDKAAGADWALVYYSGHGIELNGQNWLIPVDAQLARANDVPDEAVALERVLDRVRIASKMRIVILDACRNNPYRSRMAMNGYATRAVERGFAPVDPAHGEVVFYAARDGSVALDGKGSNSPFAAALVKHMDEDGIELGRFFRRVTSSVLAATGNHQEPFVYGRIPDEDFYFKPAR